MNNDPPDVIVRRLVPEYLRRREEVASLKPGEAEYDSTWMIREHLRRTIELNLAKCDHRTLVVPESGVRVALESDTLDLIVLPLPAKGRGPKPDERRIGNPHQARTGLGRSCHGWREERGR